MESRKIVSQFESAEHDSFKVALPNLDSPYPNLPLQNDVALPFTTIIALAGDYFAIPKKPICRGMTLEDKRSRFMEAYNSLAYADRGEIRGLLAMINKQAELIKQAMAKGESEHSAVVSYYFEETVKASWYTKLRFIRVTAMNIDHFDDHAVEAHFVGHELAKMAAARAHFMKDEEQKKAALAYAYSLEAFACHFFTDRFASGHIRTPRLALYLEYGADIGAILSLFMHGEDNTSGLNVTNANGKSWKTFGDGYLFESYDAETRDLIQQALSIVVSEVDEAYKTGNASVGIRSEAYKYFPTPTTTNNTTPLFKNDAATATILYRKNLGDLYSTDMAPLTLSRIPGICAHYFSQYASDSKTAKKIKTAASSAEAKLKTTGEKIKDKFKKAKHSVSSFFHCHPDKKTNSPEQEADNKLKPG